MVFIGLESYKIGLRCYFLVLPVIKHLGLGLLANVRSYYRTFDYQTSNILVSTRSFVIERSMSHSNVRPGHGLLKVQNLTLYKLITNPSILKL
jgi:hypothetical protein